MKSLKRTLALVLALVMVLGMFGIASATSFTDDASIQYTEAVDVMTGIGAIDGYADGTFRPTGTITRAEAAKMVTYAILGKSVASTLTGMTSSFTDVPAGYSWAIPSIEYLVKIGAVNGRGDGRFDPEGKVTAYEIAKMMLCAAGYGKMGEYVGNDWKLSVAIDANKLGLYTSSKAASFDVAATREEAALYAFNGLTKVQTVSFSKDEEDYTPKGSTVTNAATNATLGYLTYGLYNVVGSTDDFGRPANLWMVNYSTRPIAFARTSSAILTYDKGVSVGTLKAAITNAGYSLTNATFEIIRNGGAGGAHTVAEFTDNTVVLGGNGTVIEVYGNSTTGKITKIVVVVNYAGLVTALGKDNAATTNIDERTITVALNNSVPTTSITVTSDVPGFDAVYTAATTAAAANKQLPVLVTPENDNSTATNALTIAAAETATLTPTSYSTSSFVAGGKTYTYSDTFQGTKVANWAAIDVVFDAYGHVIYCNSASVTANYAVVLAVGTTTVGLQSVPAAELLLADGTTKTVVTSMNGTTPLKWTISSDVAAGDIITYTVSASGYYVATNVARNTLTNLTSGVSISTGVSGFRWNNASVNYYANANTLFFVKTGTGASATYQVYTGIANVPSLSGTPYGTIALTGTIANAVYLENPFSGSASSDLIFVPSASAYTMVTTTSGAYYVVDVLVNGEVKELKLSAAPVVGIYTSMVTNDAGITTLGTIAPTGTPASVALTYSGGVVRIGSAYYTPASGCVVYTFNKSTGEMTATSLAGIGTSATPRNVAYLLNTSGQVTAVFVDVTTYYTINSIAITTANITGTDSSARYTVTAPTSAYAGETVTVTIAITTDPGSNTDTVKLTGTGVTAQSGPSTGVTFASGAVVAGGATATKTITFVMPAANIADLALAGSNAA